jgi:hypothetical protein
MNQSLKMAGVATLGAGIGLVVGYKIAEKRLTTHFEERIQEEEELIKEFYSFTAHKKPYATPEEAAVALIKETQPKVEDPRVKTQRVQYNKIVKEEKYDGLAEFAETEEGCEIDEEKVVTQNVFDTNRDTNGPYIITQEEFMANDTGYEQATLTYYLVGETLSDARDEIIENRVDVIGPLIESNFGEGSSDANTVHIRNPKLQMEFEVVKSERSYSEDVLGEEPKMESAAQRIRRDG